MMASVKGDNGQTTLANGESVSKDDVRVEAYGTIDELSSFVGVLKDTLPAGSVHLQHLTEIQKDLQVVAAVLAAADVKTIDPSRIESLTELAGNMSKQLPPFKEFIIPGGNLAASYCHVCRTVCRRAERAIVRSGSSGPEISYVNRLSTYFFELARTLQ